MTRRPASRPRRALVAAVLLCCLALVASACTSGGGPGGGGPGGDGGRATGSAAADLATALATALAAGDVTQVADAASQASYVQLRGDLAEVAPQVSVASVDEASPATGTASEAAAETATVQLAWSWPLGGGSWDYATTATLQRAGPAEAWRVVWSPSLVAPDLVAGDSLALRRLTPERGRVLGAGGAVLVTDRPVRQVGIDKTRLRGGQVTGAARALARLVGVDVASYVASVRAAGPQGFVVAIVYRAGEVPASVRAGLSDVAGARTIAARQSLAPTREFAAPVLGRVGPVTAEMVQADPDTYAVGDVAGLSGLQQRYDTRLRGMPGVQVSAVDASGASRVLTTVAPVPGSDLTLGLDQRLQTRAEALLADVGPASALVALRPSTGAVLVAANGPGNGGQDLADVGRYAPGSTFKIVSSLALLRAGLTPDSPVSCPATTTVDGKVFGNYRDYPASGLGRIPLRTAVADSCNTAFVSQTGRVDPDALSGAAAALGLGVDHDVGWPAYFGSVEEPDSATQAAADLIGQGAVLASPLAMAAVIGSVASGSVVVPHLVLDPAPADDGVVPSQPLTSEEAATLRTLLRGVVTDGSGALLADVPGEPVIAKTGTAEFGTGADLATHAWMVAAQGDLAVAVFVDVGASGSGTAGPILEAFLRAAQT